MLQARKKNIIFFGLLIILPLVAFSLYHWYESNKQQLPVYGGTEKNKLGEDKQHAVLSFSFTNQQNKKISDAYIKNKIWVADYFFTHCASICPKMTNNLKLVQQAFAKDDAIKILSFTVDPERDSVQRLQEYATLYNVNELKWQLLTGEKKDLYRFARNDLKIIATAGDGGPDDFIHSEKLVLIDKAQHIRGYYDGTEKAQVEQLIKDINRLKNE